MIRKDTKLQLEIIRCINSLGYNPIPKPIDEFEWDDVCYVKKLWKECVA